MLITISWASPEDDVLVYACAEKLFSQAITAAKEANILHPWIYLNYASADQDVFGGYDQEGYKRLQAIAREIDPSGVFAKHGLCSGHFKICDHGIWSGRQHLAHQGKQEQENDELLIEYQKVSGILVFWRYILASCGNMELWHMHFQEI